MGQSTDFIGERGCAILEVVPSSSLRQTAALELREGYPAARTDDPAVIERVLIVSHDLSDNALSRAHVLWQLARVNGWDARVVGQQTGSLWPGATGEFASSCVRLPSGVRSMVRELRLHSEWATKVIACKAYPTSLGIAEFALRNNDTQLFVDIDDFDVEHYRAAGWRGLGAALRESSRQRRLSKIARDLTGMHNPLVAARQRRHTLRHPRFVSSPNLQSEYGGVLLPAARRPFERVAAHVSESPVVGFLGTVRPHKGIALLRRAVAELSDEGFSLVVTAPQPTDAATWESWTGPVDYGRIRELLTEVDIVAVPSSRCGVTSVFADGQLSIKLLDAMAAGRACVVSDFQSLQWGLSGTGVVVKSDDLNALVEGLRRLKDPVLRTRLGDAARQRANDNFTLETLAPRFAQLLRSEQVTRSI